MPLLIFFLSRIARFRFVRGKFNSRYNRLANQRANFSWESLNFFVLFADIFDSLIRVQCWRIPPRNVILPEPVSYSSISKLIQIRLQVFVGMNNNNVITVTRVPSALFMYFRILKKRENDKSDGEREKKHVSHPIVCRQDFAANSHGWCVGSGCRSVDVVACSKIASYNESDIS